MAPHISADQPRPDNREGWFKSTFSAATCTCVQVKLEGDRASIRDSKLVPPGPEMDFDVPVITVDRVEWAAFLADVRDGGTRRCRAISLAHDAEGATTVTCNRSGVSLGFDPEEWTAFSAGVGAGEFGS